MVRFFHVARSYADAEPLVDVHLTIGRGEGVLVVGPIGAGKTTLVRLLLGLETPRRGWITVDGLVLGGAPPALLAAHRRRVALIPQAPSLVADRSAMENVALALEVAGDGRSQARQVAAVALERLGLGPIAGRAVGALSSGERRWVAVARALARTDAPLLIADEPAAGLESGDVQRLGELLQSERDRGKTVVVLSRRPGLPGLRSPRLCTLDAGRIVEVHAEARRAS